MQPVPHKAFTLAALRVASLRIRLLAVETDEIGVHLNHDAISPEMAIEWAAEIGALDFIDSLPTTSTVEVVA